MTVHECNTRSKGRHIPPMALWTRKCTSFCVPHLRQVASVFQETCCPGIVEEKEASVYHWGRWGVSFLPLKMRNEEMHYDAIYHTSYINIIHRSLPLSLYIFRNHWFIYLYLQYMKNEALTIAFSRWERCYLFQLGTKNKSQRSGFYGRPIC